MNGFQIENSVLIKYNGDGGDIIIPDGVTEIGDSAFDLRLKVKSVTIPDSVTRIGDFAFARCPKIKSIVIPDSVTDIGERAFFNCYGLQSITIGNGTRFIGTEAFYNCDNLKNLTIGNSLTEIGKYAFPSELFLKECVLAPESEDATQAKTILNALKAKNLCLPFLNDHIRTNKILRKELQKRITEKRFREACILSWIKDEQTASIEKMLTLVQKMPIDEIDAYIEKAEYRAEILALLLQYKKRLYPPEVIEELETKQFEKDFGLREKTLADYRKIFKISKKDGFYQITGYKSAETTVMIPAEIQGIPVQIGSEAFQDQRHIETVYIENGITSIGNGAFSYCHNLKNVEIPDSVTTIGQSAFWACISLQRITLPASITEIGKSALYLSKNITLCAPRGSLAEQYAKENYIPFEAI